VDLVDEQDSPLAVHAEPLAGVLDGGAKVSHAGRA
jgi:hypothetical protein